MATAERRQAEARDRADRRAAAEAQRDKKRKKKHKGNGEVSISSKVFLSRLKEELTSVCLCDDRAPVVW